MMRGLESMSYEQKKMKMFILNIRKLRKDMIDILK